MTTMTEAPAILDGAHGYNEAPIGTRVSAHPGEVLEKCADGRWRSLAPESGLRLNPNTEGHGPNDLSAGRDVLRWGGWPTNVHAESEYAACPPGTRIENLVGDGYFEKADDGDIWWFFDDDGNTTGATYTDEDQAGATRVILLWPEPEPEPEPEPAPTFVRGVQGYRDAPIGTVVQHHGGLLQKFGTDAWHICERMDQLNGPSLHDSDFSDRRPVLRWGNPAGDLPPYRIGQIINSEQTRTLPIGTWVRATAAPPTGPPWTWERTEEDIWRRRIPFLVDGREDGPRECAHELAARCSWQIIKLFGELEPGTPITSREQLEWLPEGAVVCYDYAADYARSAASPNGDRWRKVDGRWLYIDRATDLTPGDPLDSSSFGSTDDIEQGRWMVHEFRCLKAWCPDGGERLYCAEQFAALPVGSVTKVRDGVNHYRKVDQVDPRGLGGTWVNCRSAAPYESEGTFEGEWTLDGYNVVVQVGDGAPAVAAPVDDESVDDESVADRVARARQAIKEAIDACVAYQGRDAYVRDGAFYLLGVNPLPEVGERIMMGAAFGLPTSSVVRYPARVGSLYQVNNHTATMPELLVGDGGAPLYVDEVEVICLGEYTEFANWRGFNHFVHTVWELQRKFRSTYDWCSAVEQALENAGLDDPGEAPDDEPVPALEVGQHIALPTPAHRSAFAGMPSGSILLPTGCAYIVKTDDGWVWTHTDTTVTSMERLVGITVCFIAEQR